jgi:hypothetical protein
MALAVVAATSFAVVSAGAHGEHEASQSARSLTGPIVPIDGHSLLSRGTPPARARVGTSVGLVVGQLRNASDAEVVVRSARLIGSSEPGITGDGRFWIVSPSAARPGEAIGLVRLRRIGIPLPGHLPIEPFVRTGAMPLLVVQMDGLEAGDFFVGALLIRYEAEGEIFESPYATNARLVVR